MCGFGAFAADWAAWHLAAVETRTGEPLLRLRRARWGERRDVYALLKRVGLCALPVRHLVAEAPDGRLVAAVFPVDGQALFTGAPTARQRLARAAREAWGLTIRDEPTLP
jgi:hypothetical protein